MKPETEANLKFLAGGIAIGIVVLSILGFTAFGWVTGGTAQEKIDEAVLPLAAEVCANNFKSDPEYDKHLAALKEKESWDRTTYIRDKGKWAVIPGEESSDYAVASACLEKLKPLLK